MKIAIYSRHGNPVQERSVVHLISKLRDQVDILVNEHFYKNISDKKSLQLDASELYAGASGLTSDVICLMSVGGDGTFLDAASLVINNSIPIVGVSTGRLGFLAGVTMDELDNALDCILSGNFTLDERNLIRVDGVPDGTHYALNDVCIQKRGAAIAEINAFIDKDFLSTYWADGLIVATPTGSTAYSLSAGGPIVTPNSSCFTISPIAPHNLSVRPIVIPDSSLIELEMITRSGSVIISIDSKSYELPMSAKLKIQKAENSVNFIKLGHMNFYQTLRDKLLWGLDIRS